MQIVIAATPQVAIPSIEALIDAGHEVTIVTQPDAPAGRGLTLKPSEISLHYPGCKKIVEEVDLQKILLNKDLLITIGFGRLLNSATLVIPRYGGINLHFSLLPKWRGAAPVQRAIEAGDKVTGVTVFQMDSGMDTGPIWMQNSYEIPYGTNSEQLFQSLSKLGAETLIESLKLIETGHTPKIQQGVATIAKKINKNEAIIDWNLDAAKIVRKIKAFSKNPCALTRIRGDILKITDAHQSDTKLAVGELSSKGEVGTATYAVQILSVIPAGKKEMSVKDWLNGFKPQPGELFE